MERIESVENIYKLNDVVDSKFAQQKQFGKTESPKQSEGFPARAWLNTKKNYKNNLE